MYKCKYRIIDKWIRSVEDMTNTYLVALVDGERFSVDDIVRLDDTNNTYSFYDSLGNIVYSVPFIRVEGVWLRSIDFTNDIKAEGSE